MSHRTGDIIADTIRVHTYDPDDLSGQPACSCGAIPLDGLPEHIARMVQHEIAFRSIPGLSDTKLKILAGELAYGELQQLAASGVDAFDLLQKMTTEDIETYDNRAACNGTGR